MRESARDIKHVLICGKGEIGTAMGQVVEHGGFVVDYYDPIKKVFPTTDPMDQHFAGYDVVHICYPIKSAEDIYPDVDWVSKNAVVIIDATIPIGLATQINETFKKEGWQYLLLHSPVRGRHPAMVDGLHKYVKFVGPADPARYTEAVDFCVFYYTQLGIPFRVLSSADACALGKLLDTTWYLTQIVFANQVSLICAKHHLNFNEVYTQFQETGDTGVKFENIDGRAVCNQFVPRPVMVPGAIGGHCLLPNLEILKPDISPAYYSWVKQMHEYFAGQLNQMVEQNANVIPLKHDGDRE